MMMILLIVLLIVLVVLCYHKDIYQFFVSIEPLDHNHGPLDPAKMVSSLKYPESNGISSSYDTDKFHEDSKKKYYSDGEMKTDMKMFNNASNLTLYHSFNETNETYDIAEINGITFTNKTDDNDFTEEAGGKCYMYKKDNEYLLVFPSDATLKLKQDCSAEIFVVGGGGGSTGTPHLFDWTHEPAYHYQYVNRQGGGGAGGVNEAVRDLTRDTNYSIIVGKGGARGNRHGDNGGRSSFYYSDNYELIQAGGGGHGGTAMRGVVRSHSGGAFDFLRGRVDFTGNWNDGWWRRILRINAGNGGAGSGGDHPSKGRGCGGGSGGYRGNDGNNMYTIRERRMVGFIDQRKGTGYRNGGYCGHVEGRDHNNQYRGSSGYSVRVDGTHKRYEIDKTVGGGGGGVGGHAHGQHPAISIGRPGPGKEKLFKTERGSLFTEFGQGSSFNDRYSSTQKGGISYGAGGAGSARRDGRDVLGPPFGRERNDRRPHAYKHRATIGVLVNDPRKENYRRSTGRPSRRHNNSYRYPYKSDRLDFDKSSGHGAGQGANADGGGVGSDAANQGIVIVRLYNMNLRGLNIPSENMNQLQNRDAKPEEIPIYSDSIDYNSIYDRTNATSGIHSKEALMRNIDQADINRDLNYFFNGSEIKTGHIFKN